MRVTESGERDATIATDLHFDLAVVGLGYVGLPLAQAASQAGLRVLGFDLSSKVVEGLAQGKSHIDDLTDEHVRAMATKGFLASGAPELLFQAAAIAICVPTPLRQDRAPDLSAVEAACETIAENLSPG